MVIGIFFAVVSLLNVILFKKVNSYINVVGISFLIGFLSTFVFQLLAYFNLGYLDPFIVIAVSIQLFAAFTVGCIINFIVLRIKNLRKQNIKN